VVIGLEFSSAQGGICDALDDELDPFIKANGILANSLQAQTNLSSQAVVALLTQE